MDIDTQAGGEKEAAKDWEGQASETGKKSGECVAGKVNYGDGGCFKQEEMINRLKCYL